MQQIFNIKLKHSTVYYLQMDRQIEQINCIIEKYLQHYINQN